MSASVFYILISKAFLLKSSMSVLYDGITFTGDLCKKSDQTIGNETGKLGDMCKWESMMLLTKSPLPYVHGTNEPCVKPAHWTQSTSNEFLVYHAHIKD